MQVDLVNYYDKSRGETFKKTESQLYLESDDSRRVEVVRGIPRFVADSNYADSFGLQWKKFRLTELDRHTGFSFSKDRLERCLGGDLNVVKGKLVLEIGCGAGRFTEVLLAAGARVVSTDISPAIDANADELPISDSHQLAQCDGADLPFEDAIFDFVICLGVVQHTPDPVATIKSCVNACKPGGFVVIDQYKKSLYRSLNIARIVRPLILRMPDKEVRYKWVKRIVDFYKPFHKSPIFFKRPMRYILAVVSPVVAFYGTLPQLDDKLQYEWMLASTHDSLTDYYKHLTDIKTVKEIFSKLPVQVIRIAEDGNGVETLVKKN